MIERGGCFFHLNSWWVATTSAVDHGGSVGVSLRAKKISSPRDLASISGGASLPGQDVAISVPGCVKQLADEELEARWGITTIRSPGEVTPVTADEVGALTLFSCSNIHQAIERSVESGAPRAVVLGAMIAELAKLSDTLSVDRSFMEVMENRGPICGGESSDHEVSGVMWEIVEKAQVLWTMMSEKGVVS